MRKTNMKKALSIVMLIYMLAMLAMPFQSFASSQGSPPEMPYEKMIIKKGDWYSSQLSYDGRKNLVVGYRGSFEKPSTEMFFTFTVKQNTVLTGVYIPFKGLLTSAGEMALVSESGNIYAGFRGYADYVGRVKVESSGTGADSGAGADGQPAGDGAGADGSADGTTDYDDTADYDGRERIRLDADRGNTIVYYVPEEILVLPKGKYMIMLDGGPTPADGYFVKGMDYKAYEKYKEKLNKWTGLGDKELIGNEGLMEDYEDSLAGELTGDPLWMDLPSVYKMPEFTLDDYYILDEIVLSTWNGGEGAAPGAVFLFDEAGEVVDIFMAQGYSRGEEPNTLWVVKPDILLGPGRYFIDIEDEWALDFDEDGEPMFAVGISPPPPLPANFTGTYRLNLDLFKTMTLMGAVDPPQNAFNLRNHELAVIDKGEYIELIGKYEGMAFSQNCPVVERGTDYAIADLNFTADLSGLPYKAKITAIAQVHFVQNEDGTYSVSADGTGYYDRSASKEKGADSNTYSLSASGKMTREDLPAFVMSAIASAYGVGNIPGPDSPIEAAAGMLFPPLVGLIVSTLQQALKPKEPKTKLSVGEQAMKDANHSMADLLVSEEEKEAWRIMADALGGSGGDPDDPFSIGDNERGAVGGGDHEGGVFGGYDDDYQSGGDYDGHDGYDGDRVGDGSRGDSGKADSGRDTGVDTAGRDDYGMAGGQEAPDELEIVTDHKGTKTTYVRDPETGEYVNPITGGVLDQEAYEKVVAPGFKADHDFIEKEWEKNKAGETAYDKFLRDQEQQRKEARAKDELMQKLGKKYGTTDPDELKQILDKNQIQDSKNAELWNKIGNIAAVGEVGAQVTVAIADAAMDGLAQATGPAGNALNSAYKVTKGMAGTMAEDGISLNNAARGAIKGGSDAIRDQLKNPYAKAAVIIGGEAIAGGMKDGASGFVSGAVEGAVSAATKEVTDRLAGRGYGNQISVTKLGGDKFRVASLSTAGGGEKWVGRVLTGKSKDAFISNKLAATNKLVMTKAGSSLIEELGIKPTVTAPLSKAAGKLV